MKVLNYILIAFLKLLSYLPLAFLYVVSDFLYYVIYHVVGYRKKVVFENLRNSFPDKSQEEITEIANKFYRHFCDMLVECVKAYSMDLKDFEKHVTFKNLEEFNRIYDEGKSIIALTTHYGNWEWWVFSAHILKHKLLIVYLPLENKAFDAYMNKMRTKFGGIMLPLKDTFRTVLDHNNRKELTVTWICADQTARWNNKFWVNFLNQETSFFTGGERIAKKTNQVVYFMDIVKEDRGKYLLEMKEYSLNPKDLEDNKLSIDYAKDLESLIFKDPAYWLWSHKRWKHKRPEDVEVFE